MIFITNAPYPADAVRRFLYRLGVRRDAYDAIISSGDVTRGVVKKRLAQRVFHIGPPRDLPIFAGLKVAFAPVESADYVVCSGLFDDRTETPENYRDMLAFIRGRSLFMVCANPDAIVERGDTLNLLRWSAGRRVRGAWRRGALLRQAARANLRGGALQSRSLSRRRGAAACPRASNRRLGQDTP